MGDVLSNHHAGPGCRANIQSQKSSFEVALILVDSLAFLAGAMLSCQLTVAVSVSPQQSSYSTMGGDKQLDRAKGEQEEVSLSHPVDSTQKTDPPGVCTGQDHAPKVSCIGSTCVPS